MVAVQSIINLYPNNDISDIIKKNNYKKIHLYVDIKNVARCLFIPDVMLEIISNKSEKYVDSTIFQSFLYFSSAWKSYADYLNLDIKIFYCTDDGESFFHKKIYKDYKLNREIGNVNMPDYYDDFTKIKRMNIAISEKIINKIPNNYFFRLQFLESDFLPYYLITREYKDETNTLHLVLSGDKDLYQCINNKDTYIIFKNNTDQFLFDSDKCMMKFFKILEASTKSKEKALYNLRTFDTQYFDLALSITGDAVDYVPGIPSLGPVRALGVLSDNDFVNKYFGDHEGIIDRLLKKENILLSQEKTNDKYQNLVIENENILDTSFKLVSFEYLSRVFEGNLHLRLQEKYDYLYDTLENEDKYDNGDVFIKELNFLDLKLSKDDMKILFS
jgi:5'-3' exonuclease